MFVPGIGEEIGGAKRWIYIGPFSVQPAEFLKLGFLVYFAALLSSLKNKINLFKDGILPILLIFAGVAFLLLKQPDTSTLVVIFISGVAMFIVAGGWWRYILGFVVAGFTSLAALAFVRAEKKDNIALFWSSLVVITFLLALGDSFFQKLIGF